MASNYTAHYGLCQWAAEDKFLREEFNGDNEKVEAALKDLRDRAGQVQDGLASLNYNVYNLVLQRYYEGKATGWARGLVFDGFSDEGRVSACSPAVVLQAGAAHLSRAGQGNIVRPRTSDRIFLGDMGLGTPPLTAAGTGVLTGLTLEWTPADPNYPSGSYLTVTVNGVEIQRQQVIFSGNGGSMTVTLGTPVRLVRGDQFSLSFASNGSSRAPTLYRAADRGLGCTALIQALGAASGTLTAKAVNVGQSCQRTLTWVRYSGGTVMPTVNGQGMTFVSRRTTVNVQGESCTEDSFEGPGCAGAITMGFILTCNSDPECVFWDYGTAVE